MLGSPTSDQTGHGSPKNREQRRAEKKQHRKTIPAAPPVRALFADALRHHQAGRLTDAGLLYRQVLVAEPAHSDALNLLGVIALQSGRSDLAVELLSKASAIKPKEASYLSNLGTALWKEGRLEDAAARYRGALDLQPEFPQAHFNLGTVLWKLGRSDDAAERFEKALTLKPDYKEALDNLGTIRKQQGRHEEAVACYRRAISADPAFADAYNNMGVVFWEQGRLREAAASYDQAIALRPDYAEAHYNLGITLHEQGKPEEAADSYRAALTLRSDDPATHDNLGTVLKELGQLDEAIASYRKALSLEPNHPTVLSNLGIALLAKGELAEGWEAHEWRWQTPQMIIAHRRFTQPQWRGEPAEGKTLLIHAEQGFGDTIQFCRYAELVRARGLRVIMEVQKPLVRLLRGVAGTDSVTAQGEEPPDFDLHCPMLSLPLALGTTMETIPSAPKYLNADEEQVSVWSARLAGMVKPGLRVGLAWAGSPRDQSRGLAAVDRRRSMSPELLAPLFEVPDARFFSLQKTPPPAPANLPMADFMHEMEDFADTAALVANLDLVISVDSAVAHLAAALGKPVWLLDRFDPCWRWFTGRRDSPWYPTLRIYRQPRAGDWVAVIAEVAQDLRDLPHT